VVISKTPTRNKIISKLLDMLKKSMNFISHQKMNYQFIKK